MILQFCTQCYTTNNYIFAFIFVALHIGPISYKIVVAKVIAEMMECSNIASNMSDGAKNTIIQIIIQVVNKAPDY